MNPPHDNNIPATPMEWLLHARSDLKFAQLGDKSNDILPQQICFHAQQAVEKSLKAVLLFSNIDFPLTHDIMQLLEIIEITGIIFPKDFIDAANLTPYAVETRYPGYSEIINMNDIIDAINIAEKVMKWAETYIN